MSLLSGFVVTTLILYALLILYTIYTIEKKKKNQMRNRAGKKT